MKKERARMLVEEARVVAEQDLASALQMLEEAYAVDPDPELMNEILLRKDALKKLDQARDRFWSRYRDNQLYSAYQILLGLPDNYRFDQEEEILAGLKEKFNEAERLVKEAKALSALEHRKALDLFRKAAGLMPDFPGLASEIAALEKTLDQGNAYLIAITRAIEKGELSRAKSLLRRYRDGYGDDDNARLLEKQIARRTSDIRRTVNLRRVFTALLLVLLLLAAAAIGVAYHDYREIERAGELWRQVRNDRAAGRFVSAAQKAEEIVHLLDRVYLLETSSRDILYMEARQYLGSRHNYEGLRNRMLVDGQYVDKRVVSMVRRLDQAVIAAGEAMGLEDYDTAVAKYEEALGLARGLGDRVRERIIREELARARSEVLRARIASVADKLVPGGEDSALAAYGEIEGDVKKYGLASAPVGRLLANAMKRTAAAKLARMEDAARKAYAGGDFDTAARLWQDAADFAAARGLASAAVIGRMKAEVGRSLVAAVVRRADAMRQKGELKEALAAYRDAVAMGGKRGISGFAPLAEARRRVGELALALDTDFVKARLDAARSALDREDLETAGRELAAARARLAASEFAADGDMPALARQAASLEETVAARSRLKEERDYLGRRYAVILRKAFGLPRDSALLNPEIVMIGEAEGKRVWSITAYSYEKKGEEESYIAYHVNYARDLEDGGWSVESSDREVRSGNGGG